MWCEHLRRGRVELPNGLPDINHGIVLIETTAPIDLNSQAADLPLTYKGTPITYLSLNDFLNIALELRTVPEMLAYLDARRGLPYTDLRVLGDERALFEFYLLHNGSLAGCVGKADAAITVASRQDEVARALQSKWDYDYYSRLLEDVADQLAARRQDYGVGLTAEALACYDAPDNRKNYLKMQAAIANLGLRERSEIGRALEISAQKRIRSGEPFTYMAMHLDTMPEWVYVLGSCSGMEPVELDRRKHVLMVAAMAHFRKTHCLQILDRDGASYEVGLAIRPQPPSSPAERTLGDSFFRNLKMADRDLTLIPQL